MTSSISQRSAGEERGVDLGPLEAKLAQAVEAFHHPVPPVCATNAEKMIVPIRSATT